MKFKSDPGRVLTDGRTHRTIGAFDENGIFETTDPYYMQRLALLFPIADEKPEKKIQQPEKKPDAPEKPEFWRHCEYCNQNFEAKGKYLTHCKTSEHKAKKAQK